MTKRQAYKEGRQLKKRLRGKGWRLRVWSHTPGIIHGWHFDVTNGAICVYPSYDLGGTTYWSLMTDDPKTPGAGYPYWLLGRDDRAVHYRDPNKLVEQQIAVAERHARKLLKVVMTTKKACGL